MLPHLAEDERFREMFADEARTVAKIRAIRTSCVRSELVSEGEELYLVMEYLEGDTLQRLTHGLSSRGQQLSLGQVCSIVAEAAAGLHAAHELQGEEGELLGVVHRDVSPHNLFVTFVRTGSVKVIDFGIAKSIDQSNSTSTGELKGKFAYMAPEQVAARGTSRRTDVFALGIVLWELLTRKRLFQRENQMVTLRAVTPDEPTPLPSTIVETIPQGLDAICARCLAERSRRSLRHDDGATHRDPRGGAQARRARSERRARAHDAAALREVDRASPRDAQRVAHGRADGAPGARSIPPRTSTCRSTTSSTRRRSDAQKRQGRESVHDAACGS